MASKSSLRLNGRILGFGLAAVVLAGVGGIAGWRAGVAALLRGSTAVVQARERLAVRLAGAAAANPNLGAGDIVGRVGAPSGLVYLAVLDASGQVVSAWVDAARARDLVGRSLPTDPNEAVRVILSAAGKFSSLRRYGVQIGGGRQVKLAFVVPRHAATGWLWILLGALSGLGLVFGAAVSRRESSQGAEELLAKGLAERTGQRPGPETSGLEALAEAASEQLRRDAKVLRQVERFFAPVLFEALVEGRRLGGEERAVAVLVVRLKGVSDLLADLEAPKVLDRINDHLDVVLAALADKGGVVGRIDVDTVVCWWGVPEGVPQAESVACRAAADLRRALFEFQRRQQTVGAEVLHAGIGVSSGRCILGKVGSLKQMALTLVGRAVGTAYRLARAAGAEEILVADNVYRLVGDDQWRFDSLSSPGQLGTQVWRLVGPK